MGCVWYPNDKGRRHLPLKGIRLTFSALKVQDLSFGALFDVLVFRR
jgi:hypothetical protein